MKHINQTKMRLQSIQLITLGIIFLTFCFCSGNKKITGDWEVIDSDGYYAEFYFSAEKIRIYHEVAGTLPNLDFIIKNDTLNTNILNYKINVINPDSLVLTANSETMYLKRIKTGFKLSDFDNETKQENYTADFYKRMENRKGIQVKQNSINTDEKMEEQVIDIQKPQNED
jgi:hypothetical protein